MITITLTAGEARFLADCIVARRAAQREADADAVSGAERQQLFELLQMGQLLHQQLTVAAYADERKKLERSAG